MNNESPLIPQGSLLEQKNKGRSRAKIAVFIVLVLHGMGLLAFLLVGCNHSDAPDKSIASNVPAQPSEPAASNPAPAFEPPATNPSTTTAENTNPVSTPPPSTPVTSNPTPAVVEPTPTPPPVTPATTTGDYKIAKGDTFGKIAKKAHISLKALTDANPGIEATKLKVGQTIHVPTSVAPASTSGGATATPGSTSLGATPATSDQIYTVKSGDSLTKIANQLGVKVKALRAANGLRTDKIKVGQKLKVPEKTTPTAAAPSSTELVPTPTPATSPSTSAPVSGAGR